VLVTAIDRLNAELAEKTEAAGVRFAGISVEPDYAGLESLARLVDSSQLTVHLERTFPFEEVADAHRLMENGHLTGKIVLTL
jgi:NADPH:quinone reductase-like Zn-dependent oxidoreductase